MRISTNSFSSQFLNQVNQLQQQQVTLQSQSATGLKVSLPEDDPAAMAQVLNLQTSGSAATQYQNNITQLQASATISNTAMTSLQTLSEQASQIATEASSSTTSTQQLSSYAQQVGQLIQQAVQLGNTQDSSGNYIFAGTDSNTKPFTTTSDANGNVTAVTYNGNSQVASSEIAPGVTVSAQTPGENNTGSGPDGLFADSSSGADLFSHLISLQQNLTAGNTTAISTTTAPQLAKDQNNIVDQISANSVMQSTLTHATDLASAQSTNVTTQISNLTSADLATTLTELQQTQTAYQAALESGTQIFSMSLLNYMQ